MESTRTGETTAITIRLPNDLIEALDKHRGDFTRTSLIRAALRRALNAPDPVDARLARV